MKTESTLKIIFLLAVVSIFLPWFTYDPELMGYCWGWQFLKWLLLPMFMIGSYLFTDVRNIIVFIATELCMVVNLAVLVIAFGRWQEVCHMIGGYHWEDGFPTAQPGYWISVVVFSALAVVLQYDLIKNLIKRKSWMEKQEKAE